MQYQYGARNKYPHMKPYDVAIWERFIAKNPNAYETVEYDIPVGSGSDIPKNAESNIARDFKLLTQRKIDVVAFKNGIIDIIEVKPNAGPSALGQVLSYVHLYKAFVNPEANAEAVVLTDRLTPDIQMLAYQMNVKILVA